MPRSQKAKVVKSGSSLLPPTLLSAKIADVEKDEDNQMKIPAGKAPQPQAAKIMKVESLSNQGMPSNPPVFEYWVVSVGQPPTVFSTGHLTFENAMKWLLANKLAPSA